MKLILQAAKNAVLGEPREKSEEDDGTFQVLSIQKLLPVMAGCAVIFIIVMVLATARLVTGGGELAADNTRYAVFFGLLVPATLAVGLALRLGMPSRESIVAEKREEARAREELRKRRALADANANAARIEANAHEARSREIMRKPLPKSLAKRENAQHDALDFLVDRRRGIEKTLAKRSAQSAAPMSVDQSRADRAASAKALFADPRKGGYETEKAAAPKVKRVA